MQISLLRAEDTTAWNDYVHKHPHATFCHRAEWKPVLEETYGMATFYLYARDEGGIRGILPLAETRSWLFGHTLISTPFCVYGGACADSKAISDMLIDEAVKLAAELQVDYLELRNSEDKQADWPGKSFYYTFQKPLFPGVEANFNAIPRKQRAMIKKGIENKLHSRINTDIDVFYQLYAVSVRNLGTPVYPKRYFELLKEYFGDHCEVLTVLKNDKPVASVLSFYFDGKVMPYYGGGLPEARSLKAHDFMYWELMRRGVEKNMQHFDFGRSIEGTGSFSFKKNWGFDPVKLFYRQRLIKARETPDFNPLNPRYRMAIKMWQHLPLPLANYLGPFLSRSLG